MHLLFIDPTCNKPYAPGVLRDEPLGGTEATVIRVAEALARTAGVESVNVMQHNRQSMATGAARYIGVADKLPAAPTHLVLLRNPLYLPSLRSQFPQARFYFWAHDEFLWPGWREYFQVLLDTDALPICVSHWHESQMQTFAKSLGYARLPSSFIYNPIADDLVPDATPVDRNKLIFFSSPHKGLTNTLRVFARLREVRELADLRLVIGNPGYHQDHDIAGLENVVSLGSLPHAQVIRELRSAFAALHLNDECPETFGLVNAEANAVGVPFLASPLGATPEIANVPEQLVDPLDHAMVIERLLAWRRHGRPTVSANEAFRLDSVVAAWQQLLA